MITLLTKNNNLFLAGHSHFANIKHRKGRQDEAKNKNRSKFSLHIIGCVREGGDDPNVNHRLRTIIKDAKHNGIPNSLIEDAINRGMGRSKDGSVVNFRHITTELQGHGGVGFLVDFVIEEEKKSKIKMHFNTVRKKLPKVSIPSHNSVLMHFSRIGVITLKNKVLEEVVDHPLKWEPHLEETNNQIIGLEDTLFEEASEAGANDMEPIDLDFHNPSFSGDSLRIGYSIFTDPKELNSVLQSMHFEDKPHFQSQGKNVPLLETEISIDWSPNHLVEVDEEDAEKNAKMAEYLLDHENVAKIWHNEDLGTGDEHSEVENENETEP